MKYYGLKHKEKIENCMYFYARSRAKLLSLLPGKKESIGKGSRVEQLLMVFCKQTKLRYNRLTEKEKQWLTRIVQKSELAKSYVPQRGKRK